MPPLTLIMVITVAHLFGGVSAIAARHVMLALSKKNRPIANARGFTFLELAIVLLICGLVVAGGMLMVKGRVEHQYKQRTLECLQEAKRALLTYSRVNKRLPFADGNDGDGTPNLNTYDGWLPYKVLGVEPVDAWGNRIRYSLSSGLTSTNSNAAVCAVLGQIFNNSAFSQYARVSELDASGNWLQTMTVTAVLVSGGARDFDGMIWPGEEKVFDGIGTYSNYVYRNGKTFLRAPQSKIFDDLVTNISASEFSAVIEICGAVPMTPP